MATLNIPNTHINLMPCRYGPMVFPRGDLYVGKSLELLGEYSADEVTLFSALLSVGHVVIEAGANIGAHTVPLAQLVGPAGRVYAFEPQRMLAAIVATNLVLNNLENVILDQSAVGAEVGMARIPMVSLSSQANFGGVSLGEGEPVRMVTIDSLDLSALRLIKVDVEGFECQVVQGAAEMIRRFRPAMYLENDRRHLSPELIRTARALDYRLWWHIPPFYTPNNFRQAENPFGGLVSVNVLCLPAEWSVAIENLPEVKNDDEWPFS